MISPGEIYVSIDIEADGRIPGVSSMINFGAVFYDNKGVELHAYEANLEPLPPPAAPDPKVTAWWEKQFAKNPKLKERLFTNVRPPGEVMVEFVNYSKDISDYYKRPLTAIAYPAGFDFTWLYWYMIGFTGESPFSFSCLDIKTFAMAKMDCDYRDAVKRNMPKDWFDKKLKHTHTGIDDARSQAALFFSMRK